MVKKWCTPIFFRDKQFWTRFDLLNTIEIEVEVEGKTPKLEQCYVTHN